MSNHYQKTLNHIEAALQDLLDDLINDINRLTEENAELVDENRRLKSQIGDARSDGYSD